MPLLPDPSLSFWGNISKEAIGALISIPSMFISGAVGNVIRAIRIPLMQIIQAKGWLDPDTYSVVDQYCVDLVQEATMGKLHAAIGREQQTENMINILTRSGKGNPCVIGEAGVGKTALVEGLAYKIAKGDVPDDFKNKRILKVNMVSLIAGKAYNNGAGPVGRMRALFETAAKDPNIILFIDEFHQIVQCNAAELFKTYIDNGDIKIIAATTNNEYNTYIAKDPALDRRFTKVLVEEPSEAQTLEMLKGISYKFEEDGHVRISEEALVAAVELTGKYMKNRSYPDKAIDVVGSAAKSVYRENTLLANPLDVVTVTEKDIQKIISGETGIPMGEISASEAEALRLLEKRIGGYIKGQEEAVASVSNAVRRSRAGMSDSSKPRASFLFAGTPNVGKTALAQRLGNEIGSCIRVDLGQEFSKRSLIDKVLQKPYSVVVFDKLERANVSTLNIISEILENGYIFDSAGHKVDFTNTIVAITTNIGSKAILDSADDDDKAVVKKNALEEINKCLGETFVNQIDEVVVFNKLNSESFKEIVKIFVNSFERSMLKQGIKVKVDESVINLISSVKINHRLGTNQIRNAISEHIKKPIAKFIVDGKIKANYAVDCICTDEGKIEFKINSKK